MDTYLKTIINTHSSELIRKNEADGISYSVMHMVWPVSRDWLSALSCYFYRVPALNKECVAPLIAHKTHEAFVREKVVNRYDGDRYLLAAMTAQALEYEQYFDSTLFHVKAGENEIEWCAADGPIITAVYPEFADDIDEVGNITNATKCAPEQIEEIQVAPAGKVNNQGHFREMYLAEMLTSFVADNYLHHRDDLRVGGYV